MGLLAAVLCVGVVLATYFIDDNKKPEITVEATPSLGCNVTLDDLLAYASAKDNKKLKSFFIEENRLSDIADYHYLTYVAIDEANNVAKERVSVNVEPSLTTYHIEVLKPLQAQIRESFKTSEYLALRNECGWDIEDQFIIEGVDYTLADTYDARIKVKKHNYVEPVYTTVEVADFKAPRIILSEESYKDFANMYYDDEYFLDFVDRVEDDKDDPNELKNRVLTNWKEVMLPSSSGYMSRGGTFTITYRVTDSDGNTGRETFRLLLEVPVYEAPVVTEGEE